MKKRGVVHYHGNVSASQKTVNPSTQLENKATKRKFIEECTIPQSIDSIRDVKSNDFKDLFQVWVTNVRRYAVDI